MESFSEHVIVGQPHTFFLHLRDEDGHPVEAKSTSSFIECVIDRSVTISGDGAIFKTFFSSPHNGFSS
jgi:hypothetical protein